MISIITFRKISGLKLFIILLALLLVVAGFAWLAWSDDPTSSNSQTNTAVKPGYHMVTDVVDGDTIRVSMDGKAETIRLIGIDSPELPDDCFARQAKSKASEALQNQLIRLEADQTQDNRDRYGRLLRYVILEDGNNFNRQMVAEGYAREFTFIEPYKYQSEFKKAQSSAKKNNLGLWAPKVC